MSDWYKEYLNEKIEKEASLKHGVMISLISLLSGISAWFEVDQVKKFLDEKNVPYEQFTTTINEINDSSKSFEEIDKSDIILAKEHLNLEEEPLADKRDTLHDIQAVNIETLLDVLQDVESNNNPTAIGDNGNAYGILQIWKTVIADVNRIYNTSYVHKDAFDPQKARDIARKYLGYYGKVYSNNEKQNPDYETLARIWNGGPRGYQKSSTDNYWGKVKSRLN